jgi:ABC-type branched-subunit amino acid transport system substrate-binding protein
MLDKGWKIEVLSGDHQNKPDVGTNIARQWIDVDKVAMTRFVNPSREVKSCPPFVPGEQTGIEPVGSAR